MDRYTKPAGNSSFRRSILFGVAGVLLGITSYHATQGKDVSESATDKSSRQHICIYPSVLPNMHSHDCSAQATEYALAAARLEEAEAEADAAYEAWYECEYGGGQSTPNVEIPSANLSVLVD